MPAATTCSKEWRWCGIGCRDACASLEVSLLPAFSFPQPHGCLASLCSRVTHRAPATVVLAHTWLQLRKGQASCRSTAGTPAVASLHASDVTCWPSQASQHLPLPPCRLPGASGIVGSGICRQLLMEGAKVVALLRQEDQTAGLLKECAGGQGDRRQGLREALPVQQAAPEVRGRAKALPPVVTSNLLLMLSATKPSVSSQNSSPPTRPQHPCTLEQAPPPRTWCQ